MRKVQYSARLPIPLRGVGSSLAVDEKAFRKGHRYMTVVWDLDRATIEHLSEARTMDSLDEWSTRSPEQLAAIEAVPIDRWVRTSPRLWNRFAEEVETQHCGQIEQGLAGHR